MAVRRGALQPDAWESKILHAMRCRDCAARVAAARAADRKARDEREQRRAQVGAELHCRPVPRAEKIEMPELPEVEITRRCLEPWLLQRKIARVRTTPNSYFFLTPPTQLVRRLRGRSVQELLRHGKYLIAILDDGSRLLLHLGMTGQLFVESAQNPRLAPSAAGVATALPTGPGAAAPRVRVDSHTHLCVEFEDRGPKVFFRDVRKFGKVRWLAPGVQDLRVTRLGVDALCATAQVLQAAARTRRIPIKSLLLDQTVLAGVGNIYADEALFMARIDPRRPAQRLTQAECVRLVRALRQVLVRAIELGGSSIRDYVQPDGTDGRYQTQRKVYQKRGQPCLRCKTPIQRIVLAQRATHFCPACQK